MSQPSAAGSPDTPIDATVRLMTPERIVFSIPLADPSAVSPPPWWTFPCWLYLSWVRWPFRCCCRWERRPGWARPLVTYFLLSWGYGAFCEGVFNGQTPGKRALGLRVVSERGVPITGAQAVLRNLVGTVDGLVPFFFMLGLSSMLLTGKFQRLGDLAAGTMVIIEQRQPRLGLLRIQEPRVRAIVDRLPVRIAAGSNLARALSDYVRRRHRFGRALREEMAEPLARPLRARYGLPPPEPADIVLCAVYHRVFLGE